MWTNRTNSVALHWFGVVYKSWTKQCVSVVSHARLLRTPVLPTICCTALNSVYYGDDEPRLRLISVGKQSLCSTNCTSSRFLFSHQHPAPMYMPAWEMICCVQTRATLDVFRSSRSASALLWSVYGLEPLSAAPLQTSFLALLDVPLSVGMRSTVLSRIWDFLSDQKKGGGTSCSPTIAASTLTFLFLLQGLWALWPQRANVKPSSTAVLSQTPWWLCNFYSQAQCFGKGDNFSHTLAWLNATVCRTFVAASWTPPKQRANGCTN